MTPGTTAEDLPELVRSLASFAGRSKLSTGSMGGGKVKPHSEPPRQVQMQGERNSDKHYSRTQFYHPENKTSKIGLPPIVVFFGAITHA